MGIVTMPTLDREASPENQKILNKIKREFFFEALRMVQCSVQGEADKHIDDYLIDLAAKYTTDYTRISVINQSYGSPDTNKYKNDFPSQMSVALIQKREDGVPADAILNKMVVLNFRQGIMERIQCKVYSALQYPPLTEPQWKIYLIEPIRRNTTPPLGYDPEIAKWRAVPVKRVLRSITTVSGDQRNSNSKHPEKATIEVGNGDKLHSLQRNPIGQEHLPCYVNFTYRQDGWSLKDWYNMHTAYRNFPLMEANVSHGFCNDQGECIFFNVPNSADLTSELREFEYIMGNYMTMTEALSDVPEGL